MKVKSIKHPLRTPLKLTVLEYFWDRCECSPEWDYLCEKLGCTSEALKKEFNSLGFK